MIGSTIVSSHEDGLAKLARHARFVLVALAAVQLGTAAFLWLAQPVPDMDMMGGLLFVGVVFVALAAWARERPLPAVLSGLGIYLLGVALAAAADPATLLQGWTGKAIVAVMFYNGIATALTYNAMLRAKPPVVTTPAAPAERAPLEPGRRRGRRGAVKQ